MFGECACSYRVHCLPLDQVSSRMTCRAHHLISEHNVSLPDEYDHLDSVIRLFYAHSPSSIRQRVRQTTILPDSYTLVNTAGTVTVRRNFDAKRHPGGEVRIAAQVEMLKPVAKWLGDFEAVWSLDDTGRVFTGWNQILEMERAIEDGECKSGMESVLVPKGE